MKNNNKESYTVKFNYQKENGYWVFGEKENVSVPIKSSEKNNHNLAQSAIEEKYKNNKVQVVSVSYI